MVYVAYNSIPANSIVSILLDSQYVYARVPFNLFSVVREGFNKVLKISDFGIFNLKLYIFWRSVHFLDFAFDNDRLESNEGHPT